MDRLDKPPPNAPESEVLAYMRQVCSDVTVHDPREGFFNNFMDQIDAQVSKDFIKKFGTLKTNEERMTCMWTVKPVHTLNVQSFYKTKSNEVSEQRRSAGNKAFQAKKNMEALVLYSQAVMMADPDDGNSLAFGYANRSAVFQHMKKDKQCLQDVDLALKAGYPAKLHYKVLERRGQCLVRLDKPGQAAEAFKAALDALDSSDLTGEKLAGWRKDLGKKVDICRSKAGDDKEKLDKKEEKFGLYQGSNPAMPAASVAVSVQSSPQAGRFAVVNRDVPTCQVLIAERPYSAVLKIEMGGSHCTHCYNQLVECAAVPCRWCAGVAFCGPRCRDLALATYHRWECKYQSLFRAAGVSLNTYLALRIITQHGLHFFKKLRHRLKEPPQLPSTAAPLLTDDYLRVYQMVGLEEERTPSDHFKRTLMATILLKVLQRAHFFGKWIEDERKPDAELSEDELLIGGLLLRHLQIIQFNAHELSGMAFGDSETKYKKTKSVILGLAVYPTVSMCNHSCYPTVGRFFMGDKMMIVNLRPLRAGDVLYENYGPVFTHNDLLTRNRKLMPRYWFKCRCEACEENWPTYDTMVDQRVVKCPKCSSGLPLRGQKQSHAKCALCGTSVNVIDTLKAVDDAQKMYMAGRKHLDDGEGEEAIRCFSQFVEVVAKVLKPPYRELHLAIQSMRLLVAARGTIQTVYTK